MLALITATRNSAQTLPRTLMSVSGLRRDVNHIFVDGASDDETGQLLDAYVTTNSRARFLAQTDSGLYQAINQGVQAAIEDSEISHIALLHSDDVLLTENFSGYVDRTMESGADVGYSNIEFHDSAGRCVRRWKSGGFSRFRLRTGWMPPHTSLIVRKSVYETSGLYDPDFGTAADYEWIIRVFLNSQYRFQFTPLSTLSMLVGGASGVSLKARLRANAMDGKVWVGRSRLQSGIVRICKPLRKVGQFI
jgi:glycosyltransferase